MKRFALAALIASATLLVPVAQAAPEAPAKMSAVATRLALRDLWVEHVFWIRNAELAAAANNAAERTAAEAQVVANARSIADSIAPFYGKAASDKLFGLLAGHWGAVKAYLDATDAGNAAGQTEATKQLTANAGEIADFLSGANPNWPRATLVSLLTAHGAHHVAQIQQLHAGQYDAEAKTWAAMRAHMYVIADALTDGIAKQFPDRFDGGVAMAAAHHH